MSGVRIVRVRSNDITRLEGNPELFDDPVDRGAAVAYVRDPANVVLIAVERGAVVGFLRGTALRQLHTRQRQMFLYEIAVAPAFRRRGVARALILRLLAISRRAGHDEVFVFTSPNNAPAVGLYRGTGAVTETDADRMFVYQLRRNGPHGRRTPNSPPPGRRGSSRSRRAAVDPSPMRRRRGRLIPRGHVRPRS